jgi:DNA-directed RNA polymerase sigma subunit (sigma70/sigma32)
MTTGPDTLLDALAAEVRANPPLDLGKVSELLDEAHDHPHGTAATTLVEHHLFLCLEAALAQAPAVLDVADLFQEASVALVAAVADYATRGGPASGLLDHCRSAIALHLTAVLGDAERGRQDDDAFVRDSRLLEGVDVELRRRLGRDPTTAEVAATLSWEEERVAVMATLLAEARARNDASLLPFLDDLDGSDDIADTNGGSGPESHPPG